jgi:hypothetical protein
VDPLGAADADGLALADADGPGLALAGADADGDGLARFSGHRSSTRRFVCSP